MVPRTTPLPLRRETALLLRFRCLLPCPGGQSVAAPVTRLLDSYNSLIPASAECWLPATDARMASAIEAPRHNGSENIPQSVTDAAIPTNALSLEH